jgi:hypothetical protein
MADRAFARIERSTQFFDGGVRNMGGYFYPLISPAVERHTTSGREFSDPEVDTPAVPDGASGELDRCSEIVIR